MSNVTNMQAASDVGDVIRQQGWTDETYLHVLCDYITLYQLWDQVRAYVQERAREENEEAKGAV